MSFKGFKTGLVQKPVPTRAPSLNAHAVYSMKPPLSLDLSATDYDCTMRGNDTLGDCVAVGVTNNLLGQASESGFQIGIPEAKTIEMYSDFSGYVPGDPTTDHGCNEVDALNWAVVNGIDTGDQSRYYPIWADIDPENLTLMFAVAAYISQPLLQINFAPADEMNAGIWDISTPPSWGDPRPSPSLAHCLLARDYSGLSDTDTVRLPTYGNINQRATVRWLRSRLTGIKLVFYRQLLPPSGENFAHLDFDRIQEECMQCAAG